MTPWEWFKLIILFPFMIVRALFTVIVLSYLCLISYLVTFNIDPLEPMEKWYGERHCNLI